MDYSTLPGVQAIQNYLSGQNIQNSLGGLRTPQANPTFNNGLTPQQ